jgi:hypothetical protein
MLRQIVRSVRGWAVAVRALFPPDSVRGNQPFRLLPTHTGKTDRRRTSCRGRGRCLQDGRYGVTSPLPSTNGWSATGFAAADLVADGLLDIVVARTDAPNSVTFGRR